MPTVGQPKGPLHRRIEAKRVVRYSEAKVTAMNVMFLASAVVSLAILVFLAGRSGARRVAGTLRPR